MFHPRMLARFSRYLTLKCWALRPVRSAQSASCWRRCALTAWVRADFAVGVGDCCGRLFTWPGQGGRVEARPGESRGERAQCTDDADGTDGAGNGPGHLRGEPTGQKTDTLGGKLPGTRKTERLATLMVRGKPYEGATRGYLVGGTRPRYQQKEDCRWQLRSGQEDDVGQGRSDCQRSKPLESAPRSYPAAAKHVCAEDGPRGAGDEQ